MNTKMEDFCDDVEIKHEPLEPDVEPFVSILFVFCSLLKLFSKNAVGEIIFGLSSPRVFPVLRYAAISLVRPLEVLEEIPAQTKAVVLEATRSQLL